jgi:hypothetical protein
MSYTELNIDQGCDFSTTVNIESDTTGGAINIAGYLITSKIKKSLLSQNAVGEFVCTITNQNTGEILIAMDAANTTNINPGRYFFDVIVTDTEQGNTKSRLIQGLVEVTPGISL